jgi:ABC-type dipeptide/oligopeptide/nickel transport system ATPase component
MTNVILEVKNLNVEFTTDDGIVHAVNNVSYTVERGKTLAIVGELVQAKAFQVLL